MSINAWSLKTGLAVDALDWFGKRYVRARALATAAGVSAADNFDTVIGDDFGGTITSELVTDAGTASATPSTDDRAGVVTVSVGSGVDTNSRARLQLTGSPTHVSENFWYIAALVKITQPLDVTQLAETEADAVGLWGDNDNRVGVGILGNHSGGSTSNWVAFTDAGGSFNTILGPALDGPESPVWHLLEMWTVDNATVRAALDGTEFLSTLSVADLPVSRMLLSPTYQRSAIGDELLANVDKYVVIVRSPTVGGP